MAEHTGASFSVAQPSAPRAGLGRGKVVVLIVLCVVAIVVLRGLAAQLDFATVNVLTLVLTTIAVLGAVVHVARCRELPQWLRVAPAALLVGMLAGGAYWLRIDGVDGRLLPRFAYRWARKPDQLLAPLELPKVEQPVDLATTTADDFPQFLGPDRDLQVHHVRLAREWQTVRPREVWRRPVGAGWSGFSAVNGFGVTMEQRGDEELVSCYELRTGKPRWSHALPARHETVLGGVGPRCTPTISGGKVYAQGATGVLRCLDGATGRAIWTDNILSRYGVTAEQDLRAVGWGRSGSPLIVDELVVVPYGGPKGGPYHSLAAYDRTTGQLQWLGGDDQVAYASPALATLCGVRQILIVNENSVSGHRVDEGRLLWSYPWPGGSASNASVSQAVVLPGDRVLLSKSYGGGAAVLQLAGTEESMQAAAIWSNRRVLKTKFTNVVVLDSFAYGLSDGILECLDLAAFRSCWKDRRRANFGHGQLLAAGDLILVQAESGEVVLVQPDPARYVELGRFAALDDQTWNNLCLYGPYLLARNASEAVCYELPLRASDTVPREPAE